jgi:hypothetical protein
MPMPAAGCFYSNALGGLKCYENPKNKVTAVPANEEEICGATFQVNKCSFGSFLEENSVQFHVSSSSDLHRIGHAISSTVLVVSNRGTHNEEHWRQS